MNTQSWTRHIIAFVAAGVIVFTSLDVFIVWRNQSADRVMKTKGGQVLYESRDYAIGTVMRGQLQEATVLHLSPDGGWSLEGSAPWLKPAETAQYGQFAVIRNLSTGPVDSYWLCAVDRGKKLSGIQLYNTTTHKVEDEYSFHQDGIIEPIIIHPGTELRLMQNQQTLLAIPIVESQIP